MLCVKSVSSTSPYRPSGTEIFDAFCVHPFDAAPCPGWPGLSCPARPCLLWVPGADQVEVGVTDWDPLSASAPGALAVGRLHWGPAADLAADLGPATGSAGLVFFADQEVVAVDWDPGADWDRFFVVPAAA